MLKSYHFDCGNSNNGPIGFCANVTATSAEDAIQKLRTHLPEGIKVDSEATGIESIDVYFGYENISKDDIDIIEDMSGNELGEFGDYISYCPNCEDEELYVIEANGKEMRELLTTDGFDVPNHVAAVNGLVGGCPKDFSTTDEKVKCDSCGAEFDLAELIVN